MFKDRIDAGYQLAQALRQYKNRPNVVVLGLARGGVVVAYEVAKELQLPLDCMVVRKIGMPGFEELALGALTQQGNPWFNQVLMKLKGVDSAQLAPIVEKERKELVRRLSVYRGSRPPLDCAGKTVIVVDDGIATGATMHAAIASARFCGAERIVVAVPVCSPQEATIVAKEVDEFVCLMQPEYFQAVGALYETFDQISDQKVIALLYE